MSWDGPALDRLRHRRRRLRRLLAVLLGALTGLALWLTLGADETGEPSRLGSAAVVPSGLQAGDGPGDGQGSSPAEREAAAAAVSLRGEDAIEVDFEDPPAAALLFDVESGEALFKLSPRVERPVASLTKVMTALLVTEDGPRPNRRMTIGGAGAGLDASGGLVGSAVGLEAGMRVKAGALFHAMLVSSANDAASALAAEVAGSVDRFVARMNRRARRLELGCTHFISPHGLEPENRSCAADLAALVRLAAAEKRITRVAAKKRAVVDFPIPGGERHLATTNPLLLADYPGTMGLKTGFTAEAGRSLAALVRRDGRTLGAVLLDSPDPAGQAQKLFDAAFGTRDGPDRGHRGGQTGQPAASPGGPGHEGGRRRSRAGLSDRPAPPPPAADRFRPADRSSPARRGGT